MLRLLAVGDLHLGRRATGIPEGLGPSPAELSARAAWARTVAYALRAGADLLLLAGDVVDGDEDFYEGYRALREGVERLSAQGVRVFAVAGNHDVEVLPRLEREVPGFRLLGKGGEWEAATVAARGETVTLWGWSFPARQVRESPLPARSFGLGPGVNLGLLHCHRDQAGSPYGPVRTGALRAAALDGWLLGHIHVPDRLEAPRPIGYLGAVTAFDPSDTGPRGPWLLTVAENRIQAVKHEPLAPIRWEVLTLDVTGLPEPEEVQHRLLQAVRALDAKLGACPSPPLAVGLRLFLTGRSGRGEAVCRAAAPAGEEPCVHLGTAGTCYFVERLEAEILPERNLEELARRGDPPGLLAKRLLALEDPQERRRLLGELRRRLEANRRLQPGAHAFTDEELASHLRRSGLRLLERLLRQRESG